MDYNLIQIKNLIYEIRGQNVMLDSDLAELYEVETKNLNKAVKRNMERFPGLFMFQLTEEEWRALRFQIGTSKEGKGGRRYLPYVFTEQGVAMLSSVLNSRKAIQINIQIMIAFVKMREFALTNKELSQRILELEKYFMQYAQENNIEVERINKTIDYLINITKPATIGFKITND